LAVASLIAYAVAALTGRMRNKSLFVTLSSIAAIALFYWGYYQLTAGMGKLVERGEEISNAVRRMLPPFYYYGKALADSDIAAFIIFALCFIVPFILVFAWLSINFIKMANTPRYLKKAKYKETSVKETGIRAALLKKEFARFFGTPIYLLNYGIGYILMIAFGVYFMIQGSGLLETIFSDIPETGNIILPLVIMVLCFTVAIAPPTAPSISLEGKYLWILRSNPLDAKDILSAKLTMNVTRGAASLAIADFCLIYRLSPSFADSLLIIYIPLLVMLLTAQLGLIANLFFPKFDSVNEVAAIKQSMSVIATLLASFALLAVTITGYVLLVPSILSVYIYAAILAAVTAAGNIIAYRFIMGRGVEMFNAF